MSKLAPTLVTPKRTVCSPPGHRDVCRAVVEEGQGVYEVSGGGLPDSGSDRGRMWLDLGWKNIKGRGTGRGPYGREERRCIDLG